MTKSNSYRVIKINTYFNNMLILWLHFSWSVHPPAFLLLMQTCSYHTEHRVMENTTNCSVSKEQFDYCLPGQHHI